LFSGLVGQSETSARRYPLWFGSIEPGGQAVQAGRERDEDERSRRLAKNEATFRELNEQTRAVAQQMHATLLEPYNFICECGDLSCDGLVSLSLLEYEGVRARPTTFLVLPGHVEHGDERVVETNPTHVVIEKVGVAGQEAKRRDPRE
jgi:hypothetical protein